MLARRADRGPRAIGKRRGWWSRSVGVARQAPDPVALSVSQAVQGDATNSDDEVRAHSRVPCAHCVLALVTMSGRGCGVRRLPSAPNWAEWASAQVMNGDGGDGGVGGVSSIAVRCRCARTARPIVGGWG